MRVSFFLIFLLFGAMLSWGDTPQEGEDAELEDTPEEIQQDIASCPEGACSEGSDCGACDKLSQEKELKDPDVREALAEKKMDVRGPGTQDRLGDVVEADGQPAEQVGSPEMAMQQGADIRSPPQEQLGGGRQRPQQDMSQSLASLGGLLQGVAALMGALKPVPETPSTPQAAPPPPEREKAVLCSAIGGTKCSLLKNSCAEQIVTADSSQNSMCCLGPCLPLTQSAAGREAAKNVADAKATPSAGFQFTDKGTTISSLDGTTTQVPAALNKGTDTVITRASTIDVLNGQGTNLYTLSQTKRGVRNHYGLFIIDPVGETIVSVAEVNGALTLDASSLLLWLAPGVTRYVQGVYETNTRLFSPQTGVVLQPVEDRRPMLTGHATFSPPTAGLTFGQGALSSLLKNAIDLSIGARGQADYIILARGKEDILLLGERGFFPLAIRSLAKGDSHVVYDLAVRIKQRYKVKDAAYEYILSPEGLYTKVKTPTGKILEESGAAPVRSLSTSQQQLLAKST
ncbi:hypothetical protein HY639_04205 [Candidatus Woesearchaeota archaeon]|nr:hypothetical protein [Candidatus Woesearchaeota archaeon]